MTTDAGIVWFNGLGFRPAIWTASHRADEVDPPRMVPAPDADVAYSSGKFDPFGHLPASGYAWGTWIPAPVAPQITAASLAGPTPLQPVSPWHHVTPSQPWWPSEPNWPDYPCNCITTPPINPPLPEPAPVPLPASAGLLLVSVGALAWLRRRAK